MKIGFVLYKFGSEKDFGEHLGAYHYVVKKMETLEKKGVDIVIIAPWVSLFKKGSVHFGRLKIIRYWPPLVNELKFFPFNIVIRKLYIAMTQKAVRKAIQEEKLDILYVRQARETGYAVAKIQPQLGIPFVFRQITAWHWHFKRGIDEIFAKNAIYKIVKKFRCARLLHPFLSFALGRKANIRFAQAIYRKADILVFSTHGASQEAVELGLDLSKVMILPEAVEENFFRPILEKKALRERLKLGHKKIALFVGRIHIAEKGIDYLIRAIKKARENVADIELLIIGGGARDEVLQVKKIIGDLGAQDYIHYIGKKPFSEIPLYINSSDVVVVPSVWMEAFGRITIEAIACGVPVITTDTGGSPEVNIHNETGLVVPSENIEELQNAIVRILSEETLAKKFGENGRRRVLENYTYEKVTESFLSLLEIAAKRYEEEKKKEKKPRVCYFGLYQKTYPRNKNFVLGLKKNNVEVIEIQDRTPGIRKFWELYWKHKDIKDDYDIMIVGFPGQIIVPFAKFLTKKPIIFDVHVSFYDSNVFERKRISQYSFKALYFYFLDWFSCILADRILLDTKEHVRYFIELFGIPEKKFIVMYHGVDDELFHPTEKKEEHGAFIIEFHGFIQILNGLEYVLQAMKKIEKEDIELWIIGSGPEYPKIKNLSENILQLKNVKFFPVIPWEELVKKISAVDIGIATFGISKKADRVIANKIYELMALKVPVITSESKAVQELFTHKENIYFCKPADPDSIASAFLEMKNNPSMRQKISENAYTFLKRELVPESVGKKLLGEINHFLRSYESHK